MEMGNIGGSIEHRKLYKEYSTEEKTAFLKKVEEFKEAKIPEEQWDSKIREFSEAYDVYIYSDEDQTYGDNEPHKRSN